MSEVPKAPDHPTWQEHVEAHRQLSIATGLLMGLLWAGELSPDAHGQIAKFLAELGVKA